MNSLIKSIFLLFSFFFFFSSIGQNNATNMTAMIQNEKPCPLRAPLVVTIVGLPCRGKSMAAMRIARHLSWKGEYAKGTDLFSSAFI